MKKLSTQELFEKYCTKKEHTKEVCRLSLLIFEEVNKNLKEMSDRKKDILISSAFLHDIGYSIDEDSHNKYSQKLILIEGLSDFSEKETEIISCICRYHRGDLPDKKEDKLYKDFDKDEKKTVKRLGGILRIADGLEDDEIGEIKDIKIDYNEEDYITEISIYTEEEITHDIKTIIRKKNLFEYGFRTQVVLKFRKLK